MARELADSPSSVALDARNDVATVAAGVDVGSPSAGVGPCRTIGGSAVNWEDCPWTSTFTGLMAMDGRHLDLGLTLCRGALTCRVAGPSRTTILKVKLPTRVEFLIATVT